MSHIAFQSRDAGPVELEAEYVVVGSGAGGAAAAVTLARGGASVIVVEAGAWRDPEDYPSSTYGALRDLFEDWSSNLARGRAMWPVVQARTVGGTTVVNSAICVRTPGDIFGEWSRDHGLDGDAMAQSVWSHQDRLEGELGVEVVPEGSLGRSNALALNVSRRMGFDSHLTRRFAPGCVGSGQCFQGCRAGAKASTNLNFVPEVLRRGGTVLSCAPVVKVRLDKRRAVGVQGVFRHPVTRARGASFVVRASKAVVVAASATHTPALLQRSRVRSRALGHYFRAHPGSAVFGLYDDVVDMNVGATQGWASTAFRSDRRMKLEVLSLPPGMAASRMPGGGRRLMQRLRDYRQVACWVHTIRADAVGTVRNGFGNRPVVRYTTGRSDMERLRAAVHHIARMHVEAGARLVMPGVHGLPSELTPDQVDLIAEGPLDPRAYVAILSHLFGGAVMGADPKRSVCDGYGRVHGHPGLVIADASALPTSLGVNPQHTIMAVACRNAEHLLAA